MTNLKIIVLCMLNLVMLWTIDISFSADRVGVCLTNGFWDVAPVKMYHIALWFLVAAQMIIVILLIAEKEE